MHLLELKAFCEVELKTNNYRLSNVYLIQLQLYIGPLWGGEKERKSVGHISAGRMTLNFVIDFSFSQRCFSDLYVSIQNLS